MVAHSFARLLAQLWVAAARRINVHGVAIAAACAAFLLLIIGGLVNATGSSLACNDSFITCNDHQFLPPMVGGVLYEHGHRLFAMTVGLLQIMLTIGLLYQRPKLRRLAIVLPVMIIAQALFGATTVHYKLLWYVSTGHLILGMSYFAMLVYAVFRTRQEPTAFEITRHETQRAELGSTRTWIGVACAMVFVQILLGGLVRHLGAALVCIGMPKCMDSGPVIPDAAIQQLHMVHRAFGLAVAVVTTIAAIKVFRRAKSWPQLRGLVAFAPLLVAGQVTLGVFTVLTQRAIPLAVAHFAGGASLWAVWMYAWLMTGGPKSEHDDTAIATAVPGASS